ncbi:IS66 family insertion sequence element accessory protein TnpA [Colwellia sp. E150_009]
MRRTQQQWLTLFKTQTESDLSIKQFCLEHGISTSNFYKNKAKFTSETSIVTTTVQSPFSQIHLAEPEHRSIVPLHDIKLNIGNIELTLDSKTEVSWLVNLVRQLA